MMWFEKKMSRDFGILMGPEYLSEDLKHFRLGIKSKHILYFFLFLIGK